MGFWNRNKNADPVAQADWLAQPRDCGCPDWDTLILAEVTRKATIAFAAIAEHSASWTELKDASPSRSAHGIMILSRRPLGRVTRPTSLPCPPADLHAELRNHVLRDDGTWDQPRALLPERWLAADIPARDNEVPAAQVAGFHAPYAAGSRVWDTLQNRLTKRQAYQQLAAWATELQASGRPTVLALDGNNTIDWKDEAPAPRSLRRRRNEARRLLDEAMLFDAEDEFHGPRPGHGLVDTLRAAILADRAPDHHGSGKAGSTKHSRPLTLTYLLKHDGHRMDRIYASPEIEILEAGVCHGRLSGEELATATKGTNLAPGSDHALVWARLDLPAH